MDTIRSSEGLSPEGGALLGIEETLLSFFSPGWYDKTLEGINLWNEELAIATDSARGPDYLPAMWGLCCLIAIWALIEETTTENLVVNGWEVFIRCAWALVAYSALHFGPTGLLNFTNDYENTSRKMLKNVTEDCHPAGMSLTQSLAWQAFAAYESILVNSCYVGKNLDEIEDVSTSLIDDLRHALEGVSAALYTMTD
jgi:hypothetical protein